MLISRYGWVALLVFTSFVHPLWASEVGKSLPRFEAKTIDDSATVSSDNLAGKVVFVDFWASWCGPCLQSMPTFNALQSDYEDHGFQVVAINVDQNVNDAKKFLSKLAVNYTVLVDSTGTVPSVFNIQTMPSSFLIDREGTIRYSHQGYRKGDDALIRNEIEKLLGDRQHAQR